MRGLRRRSILAGGAGALAAAPLAARAQNIIEGPENWATLSRAQREALYDNSAAVADVKEITKRWDEASAGWRRRFSKSVDLPYGDKPRNRWDLYPVKDAGAPCLVFVHGGYWSNRSRETFACLIEGVREAGMSAALVGYTLAPEASLKQIVAEIDEALDWLGREGGKHGISGPIILSGWSAGAHLAAMALGHPAVRAGLGISGVYELAPLRDLAVNDKLKLTDEEVASLSPLRIAPAEKPFALAYGTSELSPFVENTRIYHAYRSALHLPGALIPVPHANHFTVLEALREKDGVLARAAVELAASL